MMKSLRSHNFVVFLLRMLLLFVVFMVCRIAFAVHNSEFIGPLPFSEWGAVLKGSLVFDSASIFYINLPFIFFSLLPLRFRERKGYQQFLMVLFLVFNGAGLAVNIADVYYFPFKLSRISSEDIHFLSEGNFGTLMGSFLRDYWGGLLLWIGCMLVLWLGFRWLRYEPFRYRRVQPGFFYISQTLLLVLTAGYSIFAIRGYSLSAASFPISMSDASLYVKPQYASLVLSNPFCVIRTNGQKVTELRYMDDQQAERLYPVYHQPLDSVKFRLEGQPNIMLIIMESFGSAHLKSFSDQFSDDALSFSPFIDSLARESYVFTNAFQNGLRSIDALPAIWASIPTLKKQFLSLPNSVAQYHAWPACMAEKGYTTLFLHGSVRESMSFVSFGQMAGVQQFYSREDYEREHGSGDFDGKWGIWDHKFFPFVGQKLSLIQQPFFATLFTLSSHHPYELPKGFEGRYPEGKMPIQHMIAYSDEALREFFRANSAEDWFQNTLFILTADHGSGADNDKYNQPPWFYSVPIIFHDPGGRLKGHNDITAQHIDIMPTVLRMLGYDKEFFAFGRDLFNDAGADFAINYYGSAFNYMTDSVRYVFNEKEVVGVYRYKEDFFGTENITTLGPADTLNIRRMEAFIQQYYKHVKEKRYQ